MSLANALARPRSALNQSESFMQSLLAMREAFAIALREFQFFAVRYSMKAMKTIADIRRDNLLSLIAMHGSIANLNVALKMTRTDATLSQIKNASPDSKTGVPKSMGDAIARRIEVELRLERGWMDNIQGSEDHEATGPAFGWPFRTVSRQQLNLLEDEELAHIEAGILLTIKDRNGELQTPAKTIAR